jgi:flagellar basal-body rod protein FlgB
MDQTADGIVMTGGAMTGLTAIRDNLGIHATSLTLRETRSAMLASNIAHAATPGYKARDIDFASVLATQAGEGGMRATNPMHLRQAGPGMADLGYRQPVNPSLDGNTVELDVEQREFAENTLRYQISLTLLNRKISGLARAIKGE